MPKLNTFQTREEKEIMMSFLRTGSYPKNYSKGEKRALRRKANSFALLGDDLCFKSGEKLLKVISAYEIDLINHIIQSEHCIAHIGITKLVDLIKQKYYGIPKSKIVEFVNSCEACARFNSLRTLQPTHINDITKKYDRYIIDCVDLRRYTDNNDGYCWILNVIDTYTKYLWSIKLKRKSADEVKSALKNIFINYGVPRSIQSDNGKEFKNLLLKNYLIEMKILIIHGRPRNPKAQGQVERVNQTIKRWLAKKLYETHSFRWIDIHEDVVAVYNRTVHRATSKSPFLLFFGQAGFNYPQNLNQASEGPYGLEPINDYDDQEVSSSSYEEWDLNISSNNAVQHDDSINEPILIDSVHDEQVDNIELREDVLSHFSRYKQRIVENCNSNLIKNSISIGDLVIIKKDFDMNPRTRRSPFDSYFEDPNFTVTRILGNNMIELKNTVTNEIRAVSKGLIKKL